MHRMKRCPFCMSHEFHRSRRRGVERILRILLPSIQAYRCAGCARRFYLRRAGASQ